MATSIGPSEDNLRTYVLTELKCILRDLEGFIDDVDKLVRDYALYRLEKVILLCVQCHETLPDIVDQLTIDLLLEAHYELARAVEKEEEAFSQAEENVSWIDGRLPLFDIEKLLRADAVLEANSELARRVEKELKFPQAQINTHQIEGRPPVIDSQELTSDSLLEAQSELARTVNEEPKSAQAQKTDNQPAKRPKKDIPEELLKLYLKAGFSKTKIAKMFGVCSRTISNRIQAFGLENEVTKSSEILGTEFDPIVRDLVNCSSLTRGHYIHTCEHV